MRRAIGPHMRPIAMIAASGLASILTATAAFASEQKEGMPQLDFANKLTTSQVVWMALIFVTLYILLSRFALPQVGAVLEMRASKIGQDLDMARTAKAQADAAVTELTAATRTAQATAQAEIAGAVAAAKEATAAEAAVANAKLDAHLASAEQRIATARTAALGALRQVATETASVVVSRLTGATPDAGMVDRAVGASLASRGQ